MDNTLTRIGLLQSVSVRWYLNNIMFNARRKFYDRLFTSGTTLSKLRDSALTERLYLGPTDAVSVIGRSLAWKVFVFL